MQQQQLEQQLREQAKRDSQQAWKMQDHVTFANAEKTEAAPLRAIMAVTLLIFFIFTIIGRKTEKQRG